MIQFNLLPEVKQQFVRVNRTKRLVIMVSAIITVSLFIVFLLLLAWDGLQKKNLHDINKDIATNSTKLKAIPDLNKILTIQNQLNALPTLDGQKVDASRLFSFIGQVTPANATISRLDVDYTQNTVTITGDADSLDTVNIFADTLKFTTYTSQGVSGAPHAFSNVVLASFSRTDKGASYTFTFNFDPLLFSSGHTDVKLTVPNKITTRSEIEQPTDLFKASASASNTNTGGQ